MPLPLRQALDAPQNWMAFKEWLWALYDHTADFDLRYYGPLASNPALNPFGQAVQEGDMYFRTTDPVGMQVYRAGVGWANYEGSASSSAAAAALSSASALASAASAQAAKAQAEAARDAATVNAQVYATVAAGLAATTNTQQFQVVTGDTITRYRRDSATVAAIVAVYPAASGVPMYAAGGDVDVQYAITDSAGKLLWGINGVGEVVSEFSQQAKATAQGDSDVALGWTDADGKLLGGFRSDGEPFAPKTDMRLAALERSSQVNIIPFYGQSNSTGAFDFGQTWRTPLPWGTYPPGYAGELDGPVALTSGQVGATWTLAATYTALQPLTGMPLGFIGEGGVRGMLDTIAAAYPSHEMLTFSGGVGGQEIAVLDKPTAAEIAALPATTAERKIAAAGQTLASLTDYAISDCGTYYYAFMWLLSRSAKLVRDQGKRPVVSALVWQQGEADVYNAATYPALFTQLCKDLIADTKAITGQSERVVILAETIDQSTSLEAPSQAGYDTWVGSGYTNLTGYLTEATRVNNLFAWDIQHDQNVIAGRYASPRRDVYMVAPRYPHTSRGHLHPHAARAHGEQFGKVYRKVIIEGQPWEPVRPISWWISGTQIFVRFSVPFGPLQFVIPPQGNTHALKATMPYGFEHSAGAITQANIVQVAPDLIRITPTVAPASGQQLHYCKSVRYGSLCDSDPTAPRYTDRAGAVNVLRNYCLPFTITL